jgi:hypothetical protein
MELEEEKNTFVSRPVPWFLFLFKLKFLIPEEKRTRRTSLLKILM